MKINILILFFLFLVTLCSNTYALTAKVAGFTLESDSNQTSDSSGAYIYNKTDVVIPGKNKMDLTFQRTYSSLYYNSIPLGVVANSNDIMFGDINLGKMHDIKFNFWMGKGWSSNSGGILVFQKILKRAGGVDWWGDPGNFLKTQVSKQCIIIQIPNGNYSFIFDEVLGKWRNTIKNNFAKLEDNVDGTYVLILESGTQYRFSKQCYNEDVVLEANSAGSFDFSKHQDRIDNNMKAFYLTRIQDKDGNSNIFDYESSNAVTERKDGDYKKFLGDIYFETPDANGNYSRVSFTIIGEKIGEAVGEKIGGDVGRIIGGIIGAAVGAVLDFFSGGNRSGYSYRITTIVPSRLIAKRDNFNRKMEFKYQASLQNYDSFNTFMNVDLSSLFQIRQVVYKGLNGELQTITYDYFDGIKSGALKKVTYPNGQTESYDYVQAKTIEPVQATQNILLSKIVTETQKEISQTYIWHKASSIENNRFLLSSLSEKDLIFPQLSRQFSYTYQFPATYNIHVSSEEGPESYGFKKVVINAPNGTYTKEYDQGLNTKTTAPFLFTVTQLWDFTKRLLMKTREELGMFFIQKEFKQYDSFGQPEIVQESFSGGDLGVVKTYSYLHNQGTSAEVNFLKRNNVLDVIKKTTITPVGFSSPKVEDAFVYQLPYEGTPNESSGYHPFSKQTTIQGSYSTIRLGNITDSKQNQENYGLAPVNLDTKSV